MRQLWLIRKEKKIPGPLVDLSFYKSGFESFANRESIDSCHNMQQSLYDVKTGSQFGE